jgi:hypothetical protein
MSDLVLTMKGPQASATAMTRQAPSSQSEAGMKLVFVKTGDRYELIEAWTAGKAGFEIRRSGERRGIHEKNELRFRSSRNLHLVQISTKGGDRKPSDAALLPSTSSRFHSM